MPDRNKTKDRDPKGSADEAKRRDEAARWKEENAEAIKAYNEWVEREGLPFAKYRRFWCGRSAGRTREAGVGL
ncbi:MAG TPA: type II toxin-antitoxin system CcdA family antitoxin [Inquilinus sp.]|uniref:type II toxin-antitoxin system CcdA family antitoxin n=1 Tax=Inquilinus sp. TaxID=1932117 RepID=UPI002FA07FDB